jgi:hypothetical protein
MTLWEIPLYQFYIIGDSGFAEKALSEIPDLPFCLFIPNSVIAESVTPAMIQTNTHHLLYLEMFGIIGS